MSDAEKKQRLVKQEFRKANPEVGFRITAGEMSFVGRKIYNALVYRAQQAGLNGKGKLPHPLSYDLAGHNIHFENYWWISLADLIDDAAAGSRNHARVKDYFRNLMSVVVERNEVGWEAQHVLSATRIIGTDDPNGRGGRGEKLLVGWSFPNELEDKLIQPDQYTRLSLYYQSQLKTEQSLVLYEICKRYSTNPGKLTDRMEWQEWQARLMGTKARDTYKAFNREFLAPAIKAVNAITDIKITLIEHRATTRGRPVQELQFLIDPKAQASLELPAGPVVPSDLLNRLENIGIAPAAAEKCLSVHGEEKVKAALELVAARITNTALPAISAPAAYFKKALAEDYASGEAAKRKAAVAKKSSVEVVVTRRQQQIEQAAAAKVEEVEMPTGEALETAWAEFLMSPNAKLGKSWPASLEDADARQKKVFNGYLATREA